MLAPPLVNFGMIAGKQDIGDFPTPEFRWAGVMGILNQAGSMQVVHSTGGVAQHIGQKTGNSIDQDKSREFATRQHVVADRDLIADQVFPDAFVYALIAPAEQRQARQPGKFKGDGLVKTRPCGVSMITGQEVPGSVPSTASMAAKTGSGFMTMPPPPP